MCEGGKIAALFVVVAAVVIACVLHREVKSPPQDLGIKQPDTQKSSDREDSSDTRQISSDWKGFIPSTDEETQLARPGCEFTEIILTPKEAFDFMENGIVPSEYPPQLARFPVLVRRRKDDQEEDYSVAHFAELTSKARFMEDFGDRVVGTDFPGGDAPPTEQWESMSLRDYFEKYVNRTWTMDEREEEGTDMRYLFGPTDSCLTFNEMAKERNVPLPSHASSCEHSAEQMWVPQEIKSHYRSVQGKYGASQVAFGASGSLAGIYFHQHAAVFNEVIHGRKLWMVMGENKYDRLRDTGLLDRDGVDEKDKNALWFLRRVHPELEAQGERPLRCVAEAGDIVYLPDGCAHLTLNFGETLFAVHGRESDL